MNMRRAFVWIAAALWIGPPGAGAGADSAPSGMAFDRIPAVFRPYLLALGGHVEKKGKEKTVLTGEYFTEGGKSSRVRATIQLPRMARLEGFKDSVLAFDGKTRKNATDRRDLALLDAFLVDTAEGMFVSIRETGAVRLIGLDFRPDPRKHPDYAGPLFDIFEAVPPLNFSDETALQPRQYCFDSKTQLLDRTVYLDRSASPPTRIETRFSVWGEIDGSARPARVDRYENGKLVFSFIATGIESGPAVDAAHFR